MITNKDRNQQQMFDHWQNMGAKRRKLLEESWAGLFRKELLHQLPVEELAAPFTSDFGRPSQDLTTCLGAALFQQIFDLTDEQTQEKLAFDVQWHYALDLPEHADAFKYFSLKTIWNVRQTLMEHGIDQEMFEVIGKRLAAVFAVNTDTQRIDSVHIKSNMKKLGRIGIIVQTITKFLRNLKRQDTQAWECLDSELRAKYTAKDADNVFSRVKPSESAKTLKEVCQDLLVLVEQFQHNSKIGRLHSYQLMERVLDEQCHLVESEGEQSVAVKKPKDIPSDSLQNPSDPDASYDGHKGQGYQVQVMETYDEHAAQDEENEHQAEEQTEEQTEEQAKETTPDKNLSLITHVAVEQAHKNDSDALLPAITSAKQRGLKPKAIGADAGYGGDENLEDARKQEVEVTSPLKGRPKKEDQIELAEHTFNQANELVECVGGKKSVKQTSNGERHSIGMDKADCANCDKQGICSIGEGAKYYYFRYTEKERRISKRRVYEETQEFQDTYRYRAGVEATMSEYDRKTGVKHLRVRGLSNVRYAATMKSIGINIFRATRYRQAKRIKKRAVKYVKSFVTEHIIRFLEDYFLPIIIFNQMAKFKLLSCQN